MKNMNRVVVVLRSDVDPIYLAKPYPYEPRIAWTRHIDGSYISTFRSVETARRAWQRRIRQAGWGEHLEIAFASRIPNNREG